MQPRNAQLESPRGTLGARNAYPRNGQKLVQCTRFSARSAMKLPDARRRTRSERSRRCSRRWRLRSSRRNVRSPARVLRWPKANTRVLVTRRRHAVAVVVEVQRQSQRNLVTTVRQKTTSGRMLATQRPLELGMAIQLKQTGGLVVAGTAGLPATAAVEPA